MVLSLPSNFNLRKWNFEANKTTLENFRNKIRIGNDNTVPTKNQKGYAFSILDESVDIWTSSLVGSSSPLVDLGAGYGFQTIAALKKGRNVIAVDMETEHLKAIQNSARLETDNTKNEHKSLIGHLLDTKTAVLPDGSLFEESEVAGILLSEVVHFLSPGEPLLLFKDAYRWLQPGGLFVVTGASPALAEFFIQLGATLNGERSMDEAWNILSTEKDDKIVNSSLTLIDLSSVRPETVRKSLGNRMYCISTNELCALARCTGFEIVRAEYIIGEKYQVKFSEYDNEVLLVARKPFVEETQVTGK